MAAALQHELKMTRPFESVAHEAHLSIARTAALLEHAVDEVFRDQPITATQFNVLRILRGAGVDGLCRAEIGARMIRRVPDVTRLIDRLEEAGLVARDREGRDRRYVTTRITAKGLALLDDVDPRVAALHERLLGHVTPEKLQQLVTLLAFVREAHR